MSDLFSVNQTSANHSDQLPFSARVLAWFDQHGRKHLPWQQDKTPYRVWVSEIMLQQTQVATAIPYFQNFMAAFPTVQALAAADLDEVLRHWSGLGYYARARNLHRAAQQVVDEHQGVFPDSVDALSQLPGIGRSTAGAIVSIAHQKRAAILDGNVKRVLARHAGVEGWPGDSKVLKQLWNLAEDLTPIERADAYAQAMMDLGATVCTPRQPGCLTCPLQADCQAFAQGRMEQIPAGRPKKQLPERQCQLLIMINETGEILLEKRPASGIWGGLWSLPQAELEVSDEELVEIWRQRFGVELAPLGNLSPIRHTFSHFHLLMTPRLWRATETGRQIGEATGLTWHAPDQQPPGLPAPIKRLLQEYPQVKQLAFATAS